MLIENPTEKAQASSKTESQPTIALLPWGHVWEDFFESIGTSFESFCNQTTGGWQFGYIDGLKLAGVRTVMIYPSTRVNEPTRYIHKPTGSTICLLPVPQNYRKIRNKMIDPYPSFGGNVQKLFGEVRGSRRYLYKVLKEIAPYLTTPLGLLTEELRQQNCCAIFCQEYEYFRFDVSVLLGRLIGLPVFATFQGTTGDRNPIAKLLRPLTVKSCSGLVIGSQTEIQRVKNRYHLPSDKIAQIFNPLDLELWHPIDKIQARTTANLPTDAEIVVWHGRVEMQIKGLDILLTAWEQICQERTGRKLQLLMIGTGTDAQKLRQRIATMPVQNVRWIDEYINDRAQMRCLLSAGDVYAFPSRKEGFPVAPVEAMACGLPIVAAQASGIPDILPNGEASGGLTVPCDDVAAFTRALGKILDDPALKQRLSQSALRRVQESFSLEKVGQQLRNFLLKSVV